MPSANFINPFSNPVFLPLLERTAWLFLGWLVIILVLNRFRVKTLFETHLGQRLMGWAIVLPLYLAGVFLGRIPGLIVVCAFMIAAIAEVAKMSRLPRAYIGALGILAIVSVLITSYATNLFYSLPLIYFTVLTFVAIRLNTTDQGIQHAALALFVSIWILFGLSHFILLAHLNNTIDQSRSLLLLVIYAVSLSDIGAYVFGKLFHKLNFLDRYRIAGNISPNKTYIGVLGHIIGAAAGIWILNFVLRSYFTVGQWILIAVLIGIFGLMGGLTNSLFKRSFNVKDSSHLIPGHGGVLDRIDSIVRVVVVLYYYFVLIFK